ncbi:MAG: hypothetical protein ACLUGX_08155 [Methanobrevibacter smithii]
MKSIRQQIIKARKEKTERESELWFVDYCNNCSKNTCRRRKRIYLVGLELVQLF